MGPGPIQAEDAKIGTQLLKARAETIFEMPSFRSLANKRRCLIAADGFKEWVRRDVVAVIV